MPLFAKGGCRRRGAGQQEPRAEDELGLLLPRVTASGWFLNAARSQQRPTTPSADAGSNTSGHALGTQLDQHADSCTLLAPRTKITK